MYHWYPLALGIASWNGLGVSFTDGMCRGCAIRFRQQWDLPAIPDRSGVEFTRVAVAVALAGMLVLTVGSSDRVRIATTTPPTLRTTLARATAVTSPTAWATVRSMAQGKRPAPASRAPSPKVRTVKPPVAEPDLFAEEVESVPVVPTSFAERAAWAIPPETVSPRGTLFYTPSAFVTVPGAGLTLQTP
jgi:hypothetical protein